MECMVIMVEIIVISEFYEVFDSVYYAFCAECTRNELLWGCLCLSVFMLLHENRLTGFDEICYWWQRQTF
jgi:hypothetical protein